MFAQCAPCGWRSRHHDGSRLLPRFLQRACSLHAGMWESATLQTHNLFIKRWLEVLHLRLGVISSRCSPVATESVSLNRGNDHLWEVGCPAP